MIFSAGGFGTIPFSEKQVRRFKQIAVQVAVEPAETQRLSRLAAEAGITLQHLSQEIKHKYGYAFQELLHYSKCSDAAKLLLSTDRRIIDIALECGFSDVKYLIKYFKLFFRSTPSEFRKKYRLDTNNLSARIHSTERSRFCVKAFVEKYKVTGSTNTGGIQGAAI